MRIRGITRNVVVLGLVSFFTDVASEMLYPVIPLFLIGTLGASPALLGMIDGNAAAMAFLSRPRPRLAQFPAGFSRCAGHPTRGRFCRQTTGHSATLPQALVASDRCRRTLFPRQQQRLVPDPALQGTRPDLSE